VIGGDGIIVEVDESKFGKRKHNRGHAIAGAWVIGGVERTAEQRFFVQVVERRDSLTIVDVLSRHIAPGSVVYSDCWRGYTNIAEELDVTHFTVNHSRGFVDDESGVCTNTIESLWSWLKQKICLRGRVKDRLDGYLLEQIWHRLHKNDLWDSFLDALREGHYE
jgi:transposase-like protein